MTGEGTVRFGDHGALPFGLMVGVKVEDDPIARAAEAVRQRGVRVESVRRQLPRSVCSIGSQRSPAGLNLRGAIRGSDAALSRYSRSTSSSIPMGGSAGVPGGTPRARPSRAASPAAMAAARRLPRRVARRDGRRGRRSRAPSATPRAARRGCVAPARNRRRGSCETTAPARRRRLRSSSTGTTVDPPVPITRTCRHVRRNGSRFPRVLEALPPQMRRSCGGSASVFYRATCGFC